MRTASRSISTRGFRHHHEDEEFIRTAMIENIHHDRYLEQSGFIGGLSVTAIDHTASLYQRGGDAGVSNRVTFSRIFGRDIGTPEEQSDLWESVVEMTLRFGIA